MSSTNTTKQAGDRTANKLQRQETHVKPEAIISKASRELGFIRFD